MFTWLTSVLYFLLIGLLAGWIASLIMKGRRGTLLRYLIIGVIGALLGGFMFRLFGLVAFSLVGQLVMATVGSIVLIFLLRKMS